MKTTPCPAGHVFNEANFLIRRGKRYCRLCHNARVKRAQKERAAYIDGLKDVPCADCGGRFPPEAMDFDHVRGKKEFSIGFAAHTTPSWVRLSAEIAKCELVCANCHRVRTRQRGQHGRSS